MSKKFHCPYCHKVYIEKQALYNHIENNHGQYVSEEFPPSRLYFNFVNKKEVGHCVICGKETTWNETTERYNRFCSNKCKERYKEEFQKRVLKVHGKTMQQMLTDPEMQKKMLSNRKISGKYKWHDGSAEIQYTGSYELEFLKFLDLFLNFDSNDVISPAPQVFYYNDNGNKRFYIPDFYIPSINTLVEIKDGGQNENKAGFHEKDERKEALKDEIMKNQTEYNFVKVTDKDHSQFLNFLMKLKNNTGEIEEKKEKFTPIIDINEAVEMAMKEMFPNGLDNHNILSEGNIKDEDDIYYNKDKFDNSEINLCFITGHSGSGKSTLANDIENTGVEKYELDDVNAIWHFSDDNLKEYGDLIYSFFTQSGKKYREPYRVMKDGKMVGVNNEDILEWRKEHGFETSFQYHNELVKAFLDYAKKYAKSHKNKKFVIEGIQLFYYCKPEDFKDYAFYIKGTSAIKSWFRSLIRDAKEAPNPKERNEWILNKIEMGLEYPENERLIKKFRDYYSNLINEDMIILSENPEYWYNSFCIKPLGFNKNQLTYRDFVWADVCDALRADNAESGDKYEVFAQLNKDTLHLGTIETNRDPSDPEFMLSYSWDWINPENGELRTISYGKYAGDIEPYYNKAIEDIKKYADEDIKALSEGALNRVTMGFRISPHQNADVTLKKHEYRGFLNLIKKTNDIDDLKYLRNDIHQGINLFSRIGERIDKCNKLGKCNETKTYYDGIKKKYIDKGITSKDCEETIKWFKEVALAECNRKIKEANKNEEFDLFSESKITSDDRKVKKLIENPRLKSTSFWTSPSGKDNAIVDLYNVNDKCRGRSEVIIFKDDQIFLAKNKRGLCSSKANMIYDVPGGSWDKGDNDHALSAVREAEEEVRIKVSKPLYVGSYAVIYEQPHRWVRETVPKEVQWKGYYSEVYLALYKSKYNGFIDELDKDDMINYGKFYPIKEVYNDLHPIHKKAVDMYLGKITESFEIISERSLPKGEVTLYHGSYNGSYDKILANSPNYGKKWDKISYSSFWFLKKEYATMFATAELLQKLSNGDIYILIDNDMKNLVPEKYKEQAENIMKHNSSYVYIKKVDGSDVSGGQGRNFPEYTLGFDVKPDSIYTNSYNDMKNSIKYVSDDYMNEVIQKYKKNTMNYDNSLFGKIIDRIQYGTYQDIIKGSKRIKKYNEEEDRRPYDLKEYELTEKDINEKNKPDLLKDRLTVTMKDGEVGFANIDNEKISDSEKLVQSNIDINHGILKDYEVQSVNKQEVMKALSESSDNIPNIYFSSELNGDKVLEMFKSMNIDLEGKVAVKLHSGESGNQNFIKPDFWKPIIDYVHGIVVECNTAYEGQRTNTEDHRKILYDHGWLKNFSVDILDSEKPDLVLDIPNGQVINKNFVGRRMENYDSMLVLSHFKGHPMVGFGGSLKNISIGLASSYGKRNIHGVPAGKFVGVEGGFPQEKFLRAMAEAASTINEYYKGKIFYINIMKNLSVDCDCCAKAEDPCMKDIGILMSTDPVALDQACVDMIYKSQDKGRDHFVRRIESRQGTKILDYAEELGIGTKEYNLIKL